MSLEIVFLKINMLVGYLELNNILNRLNVDAFLKCMWKKKLNDQYIK